jgi:hypothetical protein
MIDNFLGECPYCGDIPDIDGYCYTCLAYTISAYGYLDDIREGVDYLCPYLDEEF